MEKDIKVLENNNLIDKKVHYNLYALTRRKRLDLEKVLRGKQVALTESVDKGLVKKAQVELGKLSGEAKIAREKELGSEILSGDTALALDYKASLDNTFDELVCMLWGLPLDVDMPDQFWRELEDVVRESFDNGEIQISGLINENSKKK